MTGPALALLLAGLCLFSLPGWDPQIINSGLYRYLRPDLKDIRNASSLEKIIKSRTRLLYSKDGVEANVAVIERLADKKLSLRINGKTDASSEPGDMVTQVFCGHVPFLFKPDARQVMVLGLASGVTLHAVLSHDVKQVDCLEISPEVVAASKYFNSVSHYPLQDARTRLIVNDGRFHLSHTPDKYDVIVSEPSNPWIGGMGLLFTREFFSQARKRLNSGGVMLAWIGIYDLDVDSFRMIARTFIDVFPDATLWEVLLGSDYVFVGGTESLRLDYSELKKLYNNPQISSELAFVKIGQPEQFISRLIMGPKELREFAASGSLHSDDRRQLELQVPRNTYLQTREQNILPALKALREVSSNPREYLSFGNQSDEKDLPAIESYWSERLKVMDAFMLTEKQQEY